MCVVGIIINYFHLTFSLGLLSTINCSIEYNVCYSIEEILIYPDIIASENI